MADTPLIAKLRQHFLDADFIDAAQLMRDIGTIPEGVLVMHNSYALMVASEISTDSVEIKTALQQKKDEMHDFIRKILLALENQKGLIIDGYLLLVLKKAPAGKMEVVQEIELDTKVCRKHILWPQANGIELDRLQFVTILSLPEPLSHNIANPTPFELSSEAKLLLSEYKRLGNLDQLISSIKSGDLNDAH